MVVFVEQPTKGSRVLEGRGGHQNDVYQLKLFVVGLVLRGRKVGREAAVEEDSDALVANEGAEGIVGLSIQNFDYLDIF